MEWLLDYHGKIQKRLRETVAPWHLVGNGNPHEAPSLLAHRITAYYYGLWICKSWFDSKWACNDSI